mmetsp:Transcript_74622/g.213811  ORF Transcript_74622/g.213811 Transcript_74622/m.213811 type:complete len:248 (-) Transcript_74622:1499-2242(-)
MPQIATPTEARSICGSAFPDLRTSSGSSIQPQARSGVRLASAWTRLTRPKTAAWSICGHATPPIRTSSGPTTTVQASFGMLTASAWMPSTAQTTMVVCKCGGGRHLRRRPHHRCPRRCPRRNQRWHPCLRPHRHPRRHQRRHPRLCPRQHPRFATSRCKVSSATRLFLGRRTQDCLNIQLGTRTDFLRLLRMTTSSRTCIGSRLTTVLAPCHALTRATPQWSARLAFGLWSGLWRTASARIQSGTLV